MSISVACPDCGRKLIAPEKLAGKRARCPQCKRIVEIPGSVSATATVELSTVGAAATAAAVAAEAGNKIAKVAAEKVVAVAMAKVAVPSNDAMDTGTFNAATVTDVRPVSKEADTIGAHDLFEPTVVGPVAVPKPLPEGATAGIEASDTSVPSKKNNKPASPAPLSIEQASHAPLTAAGPWDDNPVLPPVNGNWEPPAQPYRPFDEAPPFPLHRQFMESPSALMSSTTATAAHEKESTTNGKDKSFLATKDWPKLFSPPPPNTGFLMAADKYAHQVAKQAAIAAQSGATSPQPNISTVSPQLATPQLADRDESEYGRRRRSWLGPIVAILTIGVIVAVGMFVWQRELVDRLLHDWLAV